MNKKPGLLLKITKFFLCSLHWLVTVYWLICTYSLIIKAIISRPYFIEGIIRQIEHVAISNIFLYPNDRLALEQISSLLLLYVVCSWYVLASNLLLLFWKWKKTQGTTSERRKLQLNRSIHNILRWGIVACFFAVTLVWCFHTVKLVSHLTKSRYGVESIIRQESPVAISKEQPLFVNSEIKGITFDDAARAISIFYLKYIGLLYLESIFIFLVLVLIRRKRYEIENEGKKFQ